MKKNNITFLQFILGVFGAMAFWAFILFCSFGSDREWTRAIAALVVFIIGLIVAVRAVTVMERREKK